MLQKLLIERFRLKAHLTPKELQVYVLTVAGNGIKAAPKSPTDSQDAFLPMSLDLFAASLSRALGSQVVNQTALEGLYLFSKDLVQVLGNRYLWRMTGFHPQVEEQLAIRSEAEVFKAVAAAGLHAERRKLALPVVVIDHIEKTPTENRPQPHPTTRP